MFQSAFEVNPFSGDWQMDWDFENISKQCLVNKWKDIGHRPITNLCQAVAKNEMFGEICDMMKWWTLKIVWNSIAHETKVVVWLVVSTFFPSLRLFSPFTFWISVKSWIPIYNEKEIHIEIHLKFCRQRHRKEESSNSCGNLKKNL